MDFLTLAVAKLNISLSQVVDYKISDTKIVLIVDFGIAGVKKFTFVIEDLIPVVEPDAAEVEAQKVDAVKERLIKRGRRG